MFRSIAILFVLSTAVSADLIQPADLQYQGCFLAPGWRPGGVRWGYGLKALTFNPGGENVKGSLFGSSHRNFRQVGELSIENPVIPTSGLTGIPRSQDLQPFGNVLAPFTQEMSDNTIDRFGGLAYLDKKLYWSLFRYYAVQPMSQIDDATFGSSGTDLSNPQSEGLWRVGEPGNNRFHQKITSNYMAVIPKEWADSHVNGWRLAVGKGDGAGSASNSQGPAIAAVNEKDPSQAINLMFYPNDDKIPGWSACDQWEGFVWVGGNKEAVIMVGTRGLGPNNYGSPTAEGCRTSKGNHCDPYGVQALLYDPFHFALVANGSGDATNIVPYATIDLEPIFDAAVNRCEPSVGGMAYDRKNRKIYLVQDNQENPIIHVFSVNGISAPGPIIVVPDPVVPDPVIDPIDPDPVIDPVTEVDHNSIDAEIKVLGDKLDFLANALVGIVVRLDQIETKIDAVGTTTDEINSIVGELKELADAIKKNL